jgi:ferrous iron transport protein A
MQCTQKEVMCKEQSMNETPAVSLADIDPGQEVTLVSLEGGQGFRHRLTEMGLTPGVRFKLLSKGQPGPFIILVKETRLVLGRGMTDAVMVRPVEK